MAAEAALKWLAEASGDQAPPPFKANTQCIERLMRYARRNEKKDQEARDVLSVMRSLTHHYQLHGKRLDGLLARAGFALDTLDESTRESVGEVASMAVAVGASTSETTSLASAIVRLRVELARLQRHQCQLQRNLAYVRRERCREDERLRQYECVASTEAAPAVPFGEQCKRWNGETRFFRGKQQQYERLSETHESELAARARVHGVPLDQLQHSAIVALKRQLRELETGAVAAVRTQLDAYAALPVDASGARAAVESARGRLRELEDRILARMDL